MMDTNSQPEVGVGPWPGGPENWPSDDVYDPQLLADGDRRNVEDRYRYWKMEAIIADIAAHALPFEIAIEIWDTTSISAQSSVARMLWELVAYISLEGGGGIGVAQWSPTDT